MAPVRRYLRISKYSVLECRIYLDNPSLVHSWLLNPRNPVLPRVIESVRPWVLPKLREERERARKKSSNRKKGIKDTVTEDDFEVSIFLTETNTRHSILFKQKHLRDKEPQRIQSNTNRLIGETNEDPVDVDAHDGGAIVRQEDSDEEGLADIPIATASVDHGPKRRRNGRDGDDEFDSPDYETASAIEIGSDTDQPPPKRLRAADGSESDDEAEDDKKKMAMDVSYEGFAIYGRVLCLVVRKKDHRNQTSASKAASGTAGARPAGQASMENWITSTQIPVGEEIP